MKRSSVPADMARNSKVMRSDPATSPVKDDSGTSVELEQSWTILKDSFLEILRTNSNSRGFDELYRNVTLLVRNGQGALLYNGFADILKEHTGNVKSSLNSLENLPEVFIERLANAWTSHQKAIVMLQDILSYLDLVFVKPRKLLNILNLGFHSFLIKIGGCKDFQKAIIDALLKLVLKDRQDGVINCNAIHVVREMLKCDAGFNDNFEKRYFEETASFYRVATQTKWLDRSVNFYLEKIENCFRSEKKRAADIFGLDEMKVDDLLGVVFNSINRNLTISLTLIKMEGSGAIHMLKNQQTREFIRLFRYVHGVEGGVKALADCIVTYLREKAQEEGVGAMAIMKNLMKAAKKESEISTVFEHIFQ